MLFRPFAPLLAILVLGAAGPAAAQAIAPDAASAPAQAASGADADPRAFIDRMGQRQDLCFGLAAMADATVKAREKGVTREALLERRRASLGAGSDNYPLVESITNQIYEKDIRDEKVAIADTYRACLATGPYLRYFSEHALHVCPVLGVMVQDIWLFGRAGASVDVVRGALGTRYGRLPENFDGGLEKTLARYAATKQDNPGPVEHRICMIAGMTPETDGRIPNF